MCAVRWARPPRSGTAPHHRAIGNAAARAATTACHRSGRREAREQRLRAPSARHLLRPPASWTSGIVADRQRTVRLPGSRRHFRAAPGCGPARRRTVAGLAGSRRSDPRLAPDLGPGSRSRAARGRPRRSGMPSGARMVRQAPCRLVALALERRSASERRCRRRSRGHDGEPLRRRATAFSGGGTSGDRESRPQGAGREPCWRAPLRFGHRGAVLRHGLGQRHGRPDLRGTGKDLAARERPCHTRLSGRRGCGSALAAIGGACIVEHHRPSAAPGGATSDGLSGTMGPNVATRARRLERSRTRPRSCCSRESGRLARSDPRGGGHPRHSRAREAVVGGGDRAGAPLAGMADRLMPSAGAESPRPGAA